MERGGPLVRLTAAVIAAAWCCFAAPGPLCAASAKVPLIESHPLGPALLALSHRHGVQIIYLPEDVAGLRTRGVSGNLPFDAALTRLLSGTGLGYRYVDAKTVTIVPLELPQPDADRGDGRGGAGTPGVASSRRDEADLRANVSTGVTSALVQSGASPTIVEEVRVTGSRIVRSGFEAPTPVKVVSAPYLASTAPTSLPDALIQLPEFKNSQTPQNTGIGTTANAGQSFLNLRSLGVERTLVLLDGRRIVPSTTNGTIDISLLPEGLIERVDVVTGGASAAYGSDAVAGVVNFVLDSDFTGVKAQGQYGASDRGDSEHRRFSLAGGTSLLDGRLHAVASALMYRNGGVAHNASRDWFRSCSRISNPTFVPAQIVACDVRSAQFTRGGLITSGPLRGTQFAEGGVPVPFVYGELANATAMVGGGGEDFALGYQTVPAVERRNVFGRVSYRVSDRVTASFEALRASAEASYAGTSSWQGQSTGYTIYRDNAFLPQSIRDAMTAAGVTSFPLSRYDVDFGALQVESRNDTTRFVVGIDAALAGWSLSAYFVHGENLYRQRIHNNANVNRLYNAADTVVDPLTGQITCRSTLTQPGNGCVPLNLFGHGSPSAAALDWVLGTTLQDLSLRQQVFEASLAGEPLATWAGPVSLAFGAGWRKESGLQRTDAVSQAPRTFTGGYLGWPGSVAFTGQIGGWERNNPLPLAGAYDVREGFVETVVPLASGLSGARRLELNGAARYTQYSTSGGVTTWKAGLVYEPLPDLRFRMTRSRDIRAPNLTELYRGRINGLSNLIDPFQPLDSPNRNPFVLGNSFGNPDLEPEIGDTRSLGMVYASRWWPSFTASIDYYDIRLRGAITTLGGQRTVDQCYAGTLFLCQYIIRDANGVLIETRSPFLNLTSRRTRGFDIELEYRAAARDIVPGLPGNLSMRAFGNYIASLTTQTPGAAMLNEAGQNGIGGVPHWSATVAGRYDAGRIGLFLQERFVGSGRLDNALTPSMLAPEQNRVSEVFYTDATMTLDLSPPFSRVEAFLTVSNLFDRDPPSAPGAFFVFGTTATNSSLYDTVGRVWTAGVRAQF